MDAIFTGKPGHTASGPVSFDTSLRSSLDDPKGYLPAPNLVTAVNAAMLLGQPLLLNGEPGTGKSGLAHAVASELSLGPVLQVTCKSDMRSGDLFYVVDHIRRLYDANAGDVGTTESYVSLQGLGLAIVRAAGADTLTKALRGTGSARPLGKLFPDLALGAPQQSVVLIDEIDKALRDVSNDILTEIDAMQLFFPRRGCQFRRARTACRSS